MPKLNDDIYGKDDQGAAESVPELLDAPKPTLDVNGAKDSRAQSEGNHGKQGGK